VTRAYSGLPLSSAEVMDEWSCTSAATVFLYSVNRDSFTYFTTQLPTSLNTP
jgi:hypothetical protein